MSTAVERAAEVLGRHLLGPSHPDRELRGRWTCRCGAVLARIQDGQEALHRHQAEVLRDAGIISDGETKVEYGVRIAGRTHLCLSKPGALMVARHDADVEAFMQRTVTYGPWTEADDA